MNTLKKDFLVQNKLDRKLIIFGDVNEDLFTAIDKALTEIITEDENIVEHNTYMLSRYFNIHTELNTKERNFPIDITLSTYGGEVYYGLALYDIIKHANTHAIVNITSHGPVMSAGILILLSVPLEQRVCTRNTKFMIHQSSGCLWGETKKLEDNIDEYKKTNDIMFNIITSNTKITLDKLHEIYEKKQDWYIDAEKALELGLVSKIID